MINIQIFSNLTIQIHIQEIEFSRVGRTYQTSLPFLDLHMHICRTLNNIFLLSLSLSVPLSMCLNQHAFSNQQLPSMLANEVVDFQMTNCINLWCWKIFHSIPYAHLCTETRLFKILKDCTRCEQKRSSLWSVFWIH